MCDHLVAEPVAVQIQLFDPTVLGLNEVIEDLLPGECVRNVIFSEIHILQTHHKGTLIIVVVFQGHQNCLHVVVIDLAVLETDQLQVHHFRDEEGVGEHLPPLRGNQSVPLEVELSERRPPPQVLQLLLLQRFPQVLQSILLDVAEVDLQHMQFLRLFQQLGETVPPGLLCHEPVLVQHQRLHRRPSAPLTIPAKFTTNHCQFLIVHAIRKVQLLHSVTVVKEHRLRKRLPFSHSQSMVP